jgi:DNA-directed RNA polymerase subunit alpha
MITPVDDVDLDKLLDAESITRETVARIRERVHKYKDAKEKFDKKIEALKNEIKKEKDRDVAKLKDLSLILGICEWIVAKVDEAARLLMEVKSRKIGSYYLGKCYQELGNYTQAIECFERAKKTDAEEFDIAMDIAETQRLSGNIHDAVQIIKHFSQSHAKNAELYYQWGHCLDDLGEYEEALNKYEKSIQIDPDYAKSLFRIAFNYDLDGEDEKAIECYERCTTLSPTYKNALINLGILYEDHGKFEDAMYCFETVLDTEPAHERAALFLKDVKASMSMYYDEEISKKQGKENEVLNIPISDFELSVRSKNCLEKMNIRTLKDLTKITEADLLSFKNFGETSLSEIKIILAQKGLRLGQALESDNEAELFGDKESIPKSDTIEKVSELEISLRCKNVLQKIGIESIDDLIDNTEAELEAEGIKQSYIDEIKEGLARCDLGLRTDEGDHVDLEEDSDEDATE